MRIRRLAVALLIAAVALPVIPANPAAAQGRKGAETGAAGVPEDLPDRHREFLEAVPPLLSATEREAFLALRQEYQRDAFVRRFWEVRDPFPQTPGNELRIAWEERAKVARERFGTLDEDRARMLLVNGPPAEVFQGRCGGQVLLPLELWSYPGTDRIKSAFNLAFVSVTGNPKGPYRLWYPSEGVASLLGFEVRNRVQARPQEALQIIADGCVQGDQIAGRLAGAIDWNQVKDKVLPRPDEEWLAAFLASSTDVPADAPTFPARLDVAYPARAGSRTVVQGLVSIPKGEVAPMPPIATGSAPAAAAPAPAQTPAKSPEPFYSFLVDGEILREGELFDHFRFRFNVPVSGAPMAAAVPGAPADVLPLVFQRNLRPGVYTLVLKVEDLAAKRFFRDRRELEVPAVPLASTTPPPMAAAMAADAPAPPALAEANAAIRSDDHTLRLLAPPESLLTGKVRVDATTQGEGISKVSFELNGRPVLTKSRPPFSVELNLGDQPRTHRLRAVAVGAAGETLAEDELLLNSGPHRFSVRLVEPQRGKTYRQSVRAQAVVEVPEGETLERVEIFLNDTAVATLYQPPFVQPLLIPQGQDLTYVRAVAYLEGGTSSEDMVMVNRPDYAGEVDVQLVELYTAVVDRKGRPVEDVPREEFTVLEDGVQQEILRFERVDNLPIYAGLMIDTSISMAQELEDAIKGGLRFFEKVITPKDRAAVITFNNRPTLAVRFTSQNEVLAGSLQGLTAEGETAIYDSLIFALHYFGGVRGKRAIILITDGEDSRSKYPFDEALDYARRSGVTLYPIGINLMSRNTGIRMKLDRLADETGGRTFLISGAKELERVYGIIEEELRSQLLIAYQSSKEGNDGKFRAVEVKVRRPGTEAKTVRGYYP